MIIRLFTSTCLLTTFFGWYLFSNGMYVSVKTLTDMESSYCQELHLGLSKKWVVSCICVAFLFGPLRKCVAMHIESCSITISLDLYCEIWITFVYSEGRTRKRPTFKRTGRTRAEQFNVDTCPAPTRAARAQPSEPALHARASRHANTAAWPSCMEIHARTAPATCTVQAHASIVCHAR
jgi:hypothetical protein